MPLDQLDLIFEVFLHKERTYSTDLGQELWLDEKTKSFKFLRHYLNIKPFKLKISKYDSIRSLQYINKFIEQTNNGIFNNTVCSKVSDISIYKFLNLRLQYEFFGAVFCHKSGMGKFLRGNYFSPMHTLL